MPILSLCCTPFVYLCFFPVLCYTLSLLLLHNTLYSFRIVNFTFGLSVFPSLSLRCVSPSCYLPFWYALFLFPSHLLVFPCSVMFHTAVFISPAVFSFEVLFLWILSMHLCFNVVRSSFVSFLVCSVRFLIQPFRVVSTVAVFVSRYLPSCSFVVASHCLFLILLFLSWGRAGCDLLQYRLCDDLEKVWQPAVS